MTDELIEKVARDIADALGDNFDYAFAGKSDWVAHRGETPAGFRDVNQPYKPDYIDAAIAALAAINLPALTAWREAVIDELCSLHIYSAEHDADPRKAVRDIIEWNQRLALDPAVSAEARALYRRGWNEAIEAAADYFSDRFADAVQADCEGGARWLNERAAKAYLKDAPDTLAAIREGEAAIRALTKENSDGER